MDGSMNRGKPCQLQDYFDAIALHPSCPTVLMLAALSGSVETEAWKGESMETGEKKRGHRRGSSIHRHWICKGALVAICGLVREYPR